MPEAGWVRVASSAEIAEGEMRGIRVGDRDIVVYHLEDGEFYATDNVCTHEYARLSEGWLEDNEIECPLHGGKFDVRTGRPLCPPVEADLEVFEVRVSGEDVLVKIS